jgi:putative ABC transport system permease protein
MNLLTSEHIDYIVKDLNYRGIFAEAIQDELIDHICSSVETEMAKGKKFIDAYHLVLKSFGHTGGLRETQKKVIQSETTKPINMLRNYFNVAIRNLRKHSFYSFINVAGLSIGLAICFIIILFVINEVSYDKHFANADRIYRIKSEIKFGGNHYNMLYAPPVMADALVTEYPEVEASIRFRERGSYLVKRTIDNIKEDHVIWTDKDFFKLFSVPVIAGNAETALAEPNTIAISETIANKFFPNENALGQTLILDNKMNMKITAIYKPLPTNTHFHFDILISLEGLEEAKRPVWYSNNFQTYLLLRPGADAKQLEGKLPELVVKRAMPQLAEVLGGDFSAEKFAAAGNKMEYTLQPLGDIHLKSSLQGEFEPNFDIAYVYLFVAIALFILIIACINFMNLSTARSANRAKEVGIRKVMGSFRSHLMRQFLTESILLSFISILFAVLIAWLLLPGFNQLSLRSLAIPFQQPMLYAIIFLTALGVGILAGIYPSFFLSAFKPVSVLKGNVALGMKSGFIRSALVVFQFTISIFLVIGTLAVNRQLNYIQNKKLGFNKDQVLVIEDAYALANNRIPFRDEIMRSGKMENVTMTGFLPVSGTWRSDNPWWVEGRDPAVQENMVSIQNWRVDYEYIKTMGMKMKEGRDFSHDFPSDSSAVIINEAALKAFNFTGEVIGTKIATFGDDGNGGPDRNKLTTLTVVGIVENFHFESLKQNVTPLMMELSKRPEGPISFRFESQNTSEVIQVVEKAWKELAPGQPFTYYFLDERFGKMYAAETRLGNIFGIFTAIAILIACLGLFALTAFTAEQRTKEIGIRKVLGASISSIVLLLSKEFGKLILIAFALAAPLAWYGIDWWLKDYTYKTEIGVGLYLFAGIAAFIIAWVTMSFQSFKAASNDPVKSLRSE